MASIKYLFLPKQLFRYIVSGGFAMVVDMSLLWFLTEVCEFYYVVSTSIAYCVGLIITYLLSIYWIFDKRTTKKWVIELLIFALIGIAGLFLTSLLVWLFTDYLHIYYMVSKIITTLLVFMWNYLLKKIILF